MRNLTLEQKKELKRWFNKNYNGDWMFDLADNIDYDTYNKIYELYPNEVFYQNTNHYLESLVDEYVKPGNFEGQR